MSKLATRPYHHGLQGLGNGLYAWLQPDGGWGWMCVFGCTLMHFCLGGFGRSYGVIYVEVQEVFGASATIGAWIGGLSTALRMGGSEWI